MLAHEIKLRPYQVECIERTLRSTLIMLPTGAGKTLIAKGIQEKHSEKKFLFLAPKLNLLSQTAEAFAELNPQVVHGSTQIDYDQKCFVSTIQTISRRPEFISQMKFDYIIFDEMHFGSAGKMQKIIKESHVGHVIGLSATPFDKYGKLLTEGFDTIIDDYDARFMVDHGYLCDIKAINPVKVDLKGVKVTGGDYNAKDLDERVNTPANIKATVLSTAEHINERTQTIIFATSINHSENLKKLYSQHGVDAEVLHSKSEDGDEILSRFKAGNIKALVSVNMLTEGFDVPRVDTVVIARPTKSQNLYKQMIGRAMRLSEGKTMALLLDCGSVVENLGMPLDPIKERKKGKPQYTCAECGSNAPKRSKVTNEEAYTYCPVCLGNKADYQGSVECCEQCNSLYHIKYHPENYKFVKGAIYLESDCGHRQLVEAAEGINLTEIYNCVKDEELLSTRDRDSDDYACARLQFNSIINHNVSEFEAAYPDKAAVLSLWVKYRDVGLFNECINNKKNRELTKDERVANAAQYMFELTDGKSLETCVKAVKSRIRNYRSKNGRDISDRGLEYFCEYIAEQEALES